MPRSTCARRWAWTCGPTPTRSGWGCVPSGLVVPLGGRRRAGRRVLGRQRGRCPRGRGGHRRQPRSCPPGWDQARRARAAHPLRGGALLGRRATRGSGSWSWAVAGSGARPPRRRPRAARRSTCSRPQGRVLAGRVPREVSAPGRRVACRGSGSSVHVGSDRFAAIDQGAEGSWPCRACPADLVLVALGVQPATGLAGGLRGRAGAGRGGPGRPVGPFERPGGVRRRRRGRAVGRPGTARTFRVGTGPRRSMPRRRSPRRSRSGWTAVSGAEWWGVAAPACRPPIRSRTCSATSLRGGCSSSGRPGRAGWSGGRRRRASTADSEAWSAFTLDASDRLLGMCTSGRPAGPRRSPAAPCSPTRRAPPARIRPPLPTQVRHPRRCSPGRAEPWGSGRTWR